MTQADRLQTARRLVASCRRFAAARWLPFVLLVLVLGLALLARLNQIGSQSLWLDEAYTYMRAAMEPPQSIEASIQKSHVPTYFLFMHYWIAAFGDSELMMRLPSAIFGVLTAAAAFVLGRVVGGNAVGLVTALLLALSPLQVRYAQEARMYTMLTFAATVALTGLLYLLKHPDQAGVPLWRRTAWRDGSPGRARRWAWIAYVTGTVLVLYLHNTAVFFLVTCSLCALVLIAVSRGRRWAVIGNWTLANLAVLAAWSFWVGTLLQQARKVAKEFWPDYPSWRGVVWTLRDLYAYGFGDPWTQAGFALLFVLGLFALRGRARMAIGLALLALAPPALVLLVSLAKPMFLTRIMLWAAVPCFALMAAGVFALPLRLLLPYVLIGAVLWVGDKGLDRHYRGQSKPPWRKIARMLHEHDDGKTRFLTSGSQERTTLSYYWKRRSDPIPAVTTSAMFGRDPKRTLKLVRGYRQVIIIDYKKGKRYSTKIATREFDKRAKLISRKRHGSVMVIRYDLTRKPKPPDAATESQAAQQAPAPPTFAPPLLYAPSFQPPLR